MARMRYAAWFKKSCYGIGALVLPKSLLHFFTSRSVLITAQRVSTGPRRLTGVIASKQARFWLASHRYVAILSFLHFPFPFHCQILKPFLPSFLSSSIARFKTSRSVALVHTICTLPLSPPRHRLICSAYGLLRLFVLPATPVR